MTAALPCVCTHLKPRHAGETYACRDCECRRFEPDLQAGESTSARLRRVEQERDELAVRAADLEQVREEFRRLRLVADGYEEDIQRLQSGQDEVIGALRTQRDTARAELASARAELERLRYSGWCVARDGGRDCAGCGQEIRRGEAYSVNATTDDLTHIHCREGES